MSTKMFLLASLSALSVVQQAIARPVDYNFRRAAAASSIGDFGSCTVPQIKFAVGFDNRKETSFEPVDLVSYPHTSADNIDIITQFICDTLVNTCAADATAKATCATAKTAADTVTAKTGGQADAFNAVFNIVTDFAAVAEISDQGSTVVAGAAATVAAAATSPAAATTTAATTTAATTAAATADATQPCDLTVTVTSTSASSAVLAAATTEACIASTVTSTVTVTVTAGGAAATTAVAATTAASATTTSAAAAGTTAAASSNAATAGADFGTCTTPQIEFAAGLGGRKETAFEPTDLTSFNHGSADNIAVITSFICGQLGSSCKGNTAATDLCTTATAAAAAAAVGTGAQADAFNAAFGITTKFAAVAEISNQGVTVAAGAGGAAATTAAAAAATTAASSVASSAVTSAAAAAAAATTAAAATGANLQTFTGALGGIAPPTVIAVGSQFQVTGNAAFSSLQSAIERSCDVQNNQCANAANSSGNANGLTVAACNAQEATCNAA